MFEIGATLREARVRKRLTLQQVEDDIKIRVKYLQAMENEEFDVLPAPAYVKGFLRAYATYLGLDADIILQEYESRSASRQDHHLFGSSSALRPLQRRRRSRLAFLALVAVLILALIYVLNPGDEEGGGPSVNPSALSASPSGTASASPRASTANPSVAATSTRMKVVVVAAQDCYIDVRRNNAAGQPLFQGVLAAGTSRTFSTAVPLSMMVGGNPADLTLTVNGTAVPTAGAPSGSSFRIAEGTATRQ